MSAIALRVKASGFNSLEAGEIKVLTQNRPLNKKFTTGSEIYLEVLHVY